MIIYYLDQIYDIVSNNNIIRKIMLRKVFRFLIRIITNAILPFISLISSKKKIKIINTQGNRIVVSMTSFPDRIHKLHYICEIILKQSVLPDIFVIWLSKEQFPSREFIPKKLLKYEKHGVIINLVDGDLKSHKKYYYSFKYFRDETIILIDDDIIYRTNLIEDLVNYKKKYPNCIIAQYCRNVIIENNKLLKYDRWPKTRTINDSKLLFFGSGGGTLLEPKLLLKDVTNKELFLKLTPFADDIWLNTIAYLSGVNIIKTKYNSSNITLIYKKNNTLSKINNLESQNDVQLQNVISYYNINPFKK